MKKELLEIFLHYGVSNQAKKLMEECTELFEAILLDDGSEEALEHIEEEYADVENVLEQFKFHYCLDYTKIAKKRVEKINRQLERMKKNER